MTFQEKLNATAAKNNSLLCVGLDPQIDKLPEKFKGADNPLFEFNKWIVDQTKDLVCAYKPNSAFYEAEGAQGIEQLKKTCDYINNLGIPIILDAKREDIDSTNQGYARYAFEYLGVDAITLHPYLGGETLEPFLSHADKGFFILCRTSNKGAGEFQDLAVDGMPLYQRVAKNVAQKWNKNSNCMLVVGATYPKELAQIRSIVGEMTILVPGVGAQGGDLEASVKAGVNSKKSGVIISASRAIIYADSPKAEAQKLRDEINTYRK